MPSLSVSAAPQRDRRSESDRSRAIDVEMCTQAGCELRYLEEQETAICAGVMAKGCDAFTSRAACAAVEGCLWAE